MTNEQTHLDTRRQRRLARLGFECACERCQGPDTLRSLCCPRCACYAYYAYYAYYSYYDSYAYYAQYAH